MTHPTPLDPARPPSQGRRLLGPLSGALPRRRGAPGHRSGGAPPAGPVGAPERDPSWWDVVREPAPASAATVAAPRAADEPVAAEPVAAETLAAETLAVAPPLARAEGWLTARSGSAPVPAGQVPAPATPTVVRVSAVRPAPVRAARPAAAAPIPALVPAVVPSLAPAHVVGAPDDARSSFEGSPAAGSPAAGSPASDVPVPADPALVLLDGRRVALTSTALVGRNPAPRAGEAVGALVAVEDPARSVSKTHLLVGVDDAGVWVVDRSSTNGTVVTLPDGQRILCVPERRVRLAAGARVDFGDHGFTLAGPDER